MARFDFFFSHHVYFERKDNVVYDQMNWSLFAVRFIAFLASGMFFLV